MIKILTQSLIYFYIIFLSNMVFSNDDFIIDDTFSSETNVPEIKMDKNSTIQDELDAIDKMTDSLLIDTNDSPGLEIPITQEKKIKKFKPTVNSSAKERYIVSNLKKQTIESPQKQLIIQRLLDWAHTWSQGDVDKYISFYTANYSPAGKNRASWIKNRRGRISAKKNIKVDISDIQIYPGKDSTMINTHFKQQYSSIHYQDTSYKLISWKQKNNKWYISKEITVKN